MIERYEKLTEELNEKDEVSKIFTECDSKVATHKHVCYHDEADELGQCRPCKRVKL